MWLCFHPTTCCHSFFAVCANVFLRVIIYAYGMLLWEICTQQHPFENLFSTVIVAKVGSGIQENIPNYISGELQHLIQACWHQNPFERPTLKHILATLLGRSPVSERETASVLGEEIAVRKSSDMENNGVIILPESSLKISGMSPKLSGRLRSSNGVQVSSNKVIFKEVRYMVPASETIEIENTGFETARFWVFLAPDKSKSWLQVTPTLKDLAPKKKCSVKFTILVNNEAIHNLNSAQEKLEATPMLHLEKGQDYLVFVSGKFLVSSFGRSLTDLVSRLRPVRPPTSLPTNENFLQLRVPKELSRMVDHIYSEGLLEDGLFQQSSTQSKKEEMEIIRECLDTGENFNDYNLSLHSMAESIIQFLESLSEPIIPFALYSQALEASDLSSCRALVNQLPPVHSDVFQYLITFLRELLAHPENKLTAVNLVSIFANAMIRPDQSIESSSPQENLAKKSNFMLYFLYNEEEK